MLLLYAIHHPFCLMFSWGRACILYSSCSEPRYTCTCAHTSPKTHNSNPLKLKIHNSRKPFNDAKEQQCKNAKMHFCIFAFLHFCMFAFMQLLVVACLRFIVSMCCFDLLLHGRFKDFMIVIFQLRCFGSLQKRNLGRLGLPRTTRVSVLWVSRNATMPQASHVSGLGSRLSRNG